jgi:hypothetical protein
MKRAAYPPFKVTCIVTVQLADNKSYSPDIAMRVAFYINHQDDVFDHAKREAIWKLERLGADKDLLKDAYFETEDHSYIAVEPKGVRREYGVAVEAFYYLSGRKKRDVLIRQYRLVPESHAEMVEIYGKATKATAEGGAV